MPKPIHTIEDLEEHLQEDLGWRKKEMISLKILVEKDETDQPILLRSGIALLCAHFEGFIKYASNMYVNYVSAQNIMACELKSNFLEFELKSEFEESGRTQKNSVHQRLIKKLIDVYNQPFRINGYVISTNSNPSSKEIQEILLSLGIVTDIFETKSNYIDHSLLDNRHRVVHGERYEIKKEEFFETFSIIIDLLDDYEELIIVVAKVA